jgi:hypothetical protein
MRVATRRGGTTNQRADVGLIAGRSACCRRMRAR